VTLAVTTVFSTTITMDGLELLLVVVAEVVMLAVDVLESLEVEDMLDDVDEEEEVEVEEIDSLDVDELSSSSSSSVLVEARAGAGATVTIVTPCCLSVLHNSGEITWDSYRAGKISVLSDHSSIESC
jgi:hypothetical protein